MADALTVTVRELRDQLADHLRKVKAGRTVTVTSRGQPVAQLVPVAQPAADPRPFGFMKGRMWIADDFDEPLPQIDAAVASSPFPPTGRTRGPRR